MNALKNHTVDGMVQKSGVHQLIWQMSYFYKVVFFTSQVVQDLFHQQ